MDKIIDIESFRVELLKYIFQIENSMNKSEENMKMVSRNMYYSCIKVSNNYEKFSEEIEKSLEYLSKRIDNNQKLFEEIKEKIQALKNKIKESEFAYDSIEKNEFQELEKLVLNYKVDIEEINQLIKDMTQQCNFYNSIWSKLFRKLRRK